MTKLFIYRSFLFLSFSLVFLSCKKNHTQDIAAVELKKAVVPNEMPFDSTLVKTFFMEHPLLKKYQKDVDALYLKQQYHYIWYDKNGLNEFANVLYNKIINLPDEGIQSPIPYREKLDSIYENHTNSKIPSVASELLTTSLYFFYIDKVYHGLDTEKSTEMEWFLPREKQSYTTYIDSLIVDPSIIKKERKHHFSQYYLLQKVLKKYRKIENEGGWSTIEMEKGVKSLNVGDSSQTIAQVRNRLFITGEISTDSKSPIYDEELSRGVLEFKKSRGNAASTILLPSHIKDMNVPVSDHIRTLIVNMERCRWVSKDISNAKELIAVNIPAYELTYFKNGEIVLQSNVVVGKTVNKTVIFSAPMKYIVFSPYWNVPSSITQKEILPAIAKNSNYLAQHNMEWNEGRVRQKPGPKNSLGLVKFLFPNSNAIYLHDTPSKHLFSRESRAFSHGCIRVAKPVELANKILGDDENWNAEKIEQAMNAGKESWYTLKNKIPVYIGYFTAWVDTQGTVHFYDDVYKRDEPLAALLFEQLP